jgi:hypothetical protein
MIVPFTFQPFEDGQEPVLGMAFPLMCHVFDDLAERTLTK